MNPYNKLRSLVEMRTKEADNVRPSATVRRIEAISRMLSDARDRMAAREKAKK